MSITTGQSWVFRLTIRIIFPKHFGDITVQRNRLGLTDADPCEYITFERTIVLDRNFKLSNLMLCIFHAIWQPFKDNIRRKLPMSSNNKNILSPIGREMGKLTINIPEIVLIMSTDDFGCNLFRISTIKLVHVLLQHIRDKRRV
jgi:hypothetical protein